MRKEVRSLEDDTLEYYARAVEVMKGREEADPTSWWYQAGMHGSHLEPRELYNQCKHGSWYFLSWHRMYLYYFERIVRAAVVEVGGPEDWALPYWNYGLNGEFASIPDAFRQNGGNPLYVEQRAPGINEGAIMPPEVTTDEVAMGRPQFIGVAEFGGGEAPPNEQFWGQAGALEQTPHNVVHVVVGGPGGWMTDPDEAAKDPIFWLHHANIDRIWAEWAVTHPKPEDPNWLDQRFEFFDVDKEKASLSCEQVLDTIQNLEYTYDVIPGIPPEPPAEQPSGEAEEPAPTTSEEAYGGGKVVGASEKVTLTGSTEAVPVSIDNRAQGEVQEASRVSDPRRLYLNIEDIEGEQNPGTAYGVYVNLPENPDAETMAKHHVGNVSFFGIERARNPRGDEHGHNLRYSMEVGELLRSLGGGEDFGEEEVRVTFRPLSLAPPEGKTEESFRAAAPPAEDPPVQIGRVSLSVDS
ncbi:MAG: tyrosinase family protein [Actinomycetota bacterium]|nr:tyrosinase family protein [Actinomycetota bacterium]